MLGMAPAPHTRGPPQLPRSVPGMSGLEEPLGERDARGGSAVSRHAPWPRLPIQLRTVARCGRARQVWAVPKRWLIGVRGALKMHVVRQAELDWREGGHRRPAFSVLAVRVPPVEGWSTRTTTSISTCGLRSGLTARRAALAVAALRNRAGTSVS